jgi:hypothetical protein
MDLALLDRSRRRHLSACMRTAYAEWARAPIVAFAMRNCDHIVRNFKDGIHERA